MASELRAVIDIGTNSIKLLAGRARAASFDPLVERSIQTRLGRGFFETHVLQAGPVQETARAVAQYVQEARALGCASIRVIATSAARDARNPGDLIQAVRDQAGFAVEILPGDEEAMLAFAGVSSGPGLGDAPLLVFDIGGGSTELILGNAGVKLFGESFQVGSVRMLETAALTDPPSAQNWQDCWERLNEQFGHALRARVHPLLAQFARPALKLVGTGGTTSILARIHLALDTFDRERIEGAVLPLVDLQEIRRRLWSTPVAERRMIRGLPSDRADVILTGTAILESIMVTLGFHEVRVSTRGLRFGAALQNPASDHRQ